MNYESYHQNSSAMVAQRTAAVAESHEELTNRDNGLV
jgi:hypothetical protein